MNPVIAFKALADESRLRIFTLLLNHELNVNEMVSVLDMGQSRISRHLKILTGSGLLGCRRDGLWSFYSVPPNGEMKDFIKGVSGFLNNCDWIKTDNREASNIIKERTLQTKRFFNSLAPEWENIKRELFGELDINREIISQIKKCQTISDLGCGTGDLVLLLKNKAKNVIGVDNSPKMLEKARKYVVGNSDGGIEAFDFRIGEMEHLPLKENETDYAVINMVLHHLNSPQEGLNEAYRILNKSGTLIVVELSKHADENMRKKFGDRWLGFKKSELENWFLKAGFGIIKKKEFPLKKEFKVFLYILSKE
jgi:ubiquinone/menaquinone biosynthesis C-methylase UbiE